MTIINVLVLIAIISLCASVCAWLIVRVGRAYDRAAADVINAYTDELERRATSARAAHAAPAAQPSIDDWPILPPADAGQPPRS